MSIGEFDCCMGVLAKAEDYIKRGWLTLAKTEVSAIGPLIKTCPVQDRYWKAVYIRYNRTRSMAYSR